MYLPNDDEVSAPPMNEMLARRRWRAARAELERRGGASTPLGRRRASKEKLAGFVLRSLNAILRATGSDRLLAPTVRTLHLRRIEASIDALPHDLEGYRILHLSDLHLDSVSGLADALLAILRGVEADLCVVTGDFRFAGKGKFTETGVRDDLARLYREVVAPDGFLAVLGNHDPHDIVEPIESLGVRVLVNEHVQIRRGDATLHIAGTDDVHHFYTPAAVEALRSLASDDAATVGIALVHSPELAEEAAAFGYRLYLCGHTHAGQVCLPGGKPLVVFLRRNHHLARGLWRIGGMRGFTSAGIGSSGIPLRLFSRGEAALVTLRRA